MIRSKRGSATNSRMQRLAEFRYTLRKFLQFSEEAASRAGLTSQQHQLLLQIAGAPEDTATTVGYVAERLSLRHHSVVELSKRCEESGHIVRNVEQSEYRHVILSLTPQGIRLLKALSDDHAHELYILGSKLIETLAPFTKRRPPQEQP
ncbi:MarR family winged helix-turn-helix transcriptional regulator [Granulicella sp. S156]|uniref:MarR family winged helix-turn-helix transcriptional regulator n=1 Tax=Granulicella sp. S156 TaxID=1747224 RepID=UPI00131E7FEC|nr:MarR family winged helix-turn-helix transcriptional regulator [Granulicella sp. S156]